MVITPHATVGALVGSHSPNIAVAFFAGVASHYCLDAIPHQDYSLEDKQLLRADAALASTLLLVNRSPRALAGALGGIMPDLIEFGLPKRYLRPLRRFHARAHASETVSARESLRSQAMISSLAFALRR